MLFFGDVSTYDNYDNNENVGETFFCFEKYTIVLFDVHTIDAAKMRH